MVYVETKKRESGVYYYHTRGIRQGFKVRKIRRYIGKEKQKAYSLEEFYKTMEIFSQKEFEFVSRNYLNYELTYSEQVIDDIFKNNMLISNLKEFDPNIAYEIDKEFPIEFIYNSNNIEGSRMPLSEVRNVILGKKTNHTNRNEIIEAKNSIKAYKYIKEEFKFNLKSIKKLHEILTQDLKDGEQPYHQGFKNIEIVVGKYEADTTHPENVKMELNELLEWYKENKNKIFPPELAFKFYYKYEKIHPFVDGNGRTGRLIMNKILMDKKYQPMIIYKKNKNSHLNAFTKARNGNFKAFTDFMFKRYRDNFKDFYAIFLPK